MSEDAFQTGVVLGSVHFAQHVFRILPPLLPVLALSLGYPLWQLGALVSLYFAGSGFGQAPMGVLADRYDRRLIVPPSVAAMGVGYLVVAAAPRLTDPAAVVLVVAGEPLTGGVLVMGAGSLVAGLGASAIHPCGYPLVVANAPPEREGRALGRWGSAAKLGDAAAPLAVAGLVLVAAWHEVFLLFGGVGLCYGAALAPALSAGVVETRPGGQRLLDADGQADAAPADRRDYVYPFVALLVFFLARAFSEKGLKAFLPTFLVTAYGYTLAVGGLTLPAESLANVYFTAVFLVAAVTTLVTGWLVDRFDPRAVLVAMFAAATAILVVLATGRLSPLALLAVLAALGAANWGWVPARDAIMSDIAPPAREGRTFGYLHTVSHLFSAVAPVGIGLVAGATSLRESVLVLVAAMVVAVAAVAALFSGRVYRVPEAGGTSDPE
ncbi:MAG: arabinose efflux permease [uncultured archaeon A07HB70]|nr:MAG: arabinose efflux permease [uncultured archaeon A07HB70]